MSLASVAIDGDFEIKIMTDTEGSITLFIQSLSLSQVISYEDDPGGNKYLDVSAPNFIEKLKGITWEDKISVGIQKLQSRIESLKRTPFSGLTPQQIAEKVARKFANDVAK